MDDPRDDAIVNAVVGKISAIFEPRADLTAQRLDAIERHINVLEDRIDHLARLGTEIQRGAAHTQMLASQTWAQTHPGEPTPGAPPPLPGAPRPTAVDEACAVPPGEPARVVRLPRYGSTLIPEPGADPATVWAHHIQSLNSAEGSTRGPQGSRRTRRH